MKPANGTPLLTVFFERSPSGRAFRSIFAASGTLRSQRMPLQSLTPAGQSRTTVSSSSPAVTSIASAAGANNHSSKNTPLPTSAKTKPHSRTADTARANNYSPLPAVHCILSLFGSAFAGRERDGIVTAGNASLACGYGNRAFQAKGTTLPASAKAKIYDRTASVAGANNHSSKSTALPTSAKAKLPAGIAAFTEHIYGNTTFVALKGRNFHNRRRAKHCLRPCTTPSLCPTGQNFLFLFGSAFAGRERDDIVTTGNASLACGYGNRAFQAKGTTLPTSAKAEPYGGIADVAGANNHSSKSTALQSPAKAKPYGGTAELVRGVIALPKYTVLPASAKANFFAETTALAKLQCSVVHQYVIGISDINPSCTGTPAENPSKSRCINRLKRKFRQNQVRRINSSGNPAGANSLEIIKAEIPLESIRKEILKRESRWSQFARFYASGNSAGVNSAGIVKAGFPPELIRKEILKRESRRS